MPSDNAEFRNDAEVQNAAKQLFLGCAPEREDELMKLWGDLAPEFQVHVDNHREGYFLVDAGLYKFVRFNHRALRVFWLGSFIAWEAFRAPREANGAGVDWTRLKELLSTFEEILAATSAENVPLPAGIAEPGIYPDKDIDVAARAATELATIAVGWALLHEVGHLQHQQRGTGAEMYSGDSSQFHKEELSCDEFATKFLTGTIPAYSQETGNDARKVQQKRELGIYFALFSIALVNKGNWGETKTHPSLADRIAATKQQLGPTRHPDAEDIAAEAFRSLGQFWKGAPQF
jgi:Peptidase U49